MENIHIFITFLSGLGNLTTRCKFPQCTNHPDDPKGPSILPSLPSLCPTNYYPRCAAPAPLGCGHTKVPWLALASKQSSLSSSLEYQVFLRLPYAFSILMLLSCFLMIFQGFSGFLRLSQFFSLKFCQFLSSKQFTQQTKTDTQMQKTNNPFRCNTWKCNICNTPAAKKSTQVFHILERTHVHRCPYLVEKSPVSRNHKVDQVYCGQTALYPKVYGRKVFYNQRRYQQWKR